MNRNKHLAPACMALALFKAGRSLCGTGALALMLLGTPARAGVAITSVVNGSSAPVLDSSFGTMELALNLGNGGALVRNGISFANSAAAGATPVVYGTANGITVRASTTSGQSFVNANLGGEALYATESYTTGNAALTVNITGLNPLKTYLVQIMHGDPRTAGWATYTAGAITATDSLSNVDTDSLSFGGPTTTLRYALVTINVSGTTSLNYFMPAAGRGPSVAGVTVQADAPLPTSSNDSLTIVEDTSTLVSTNDFGSYSDPNSQPLAAVKITNLASAGSLEYDTTGAGAWVPVTVDQEISAADITAGRLRFSPVADGNGTPYATIGFRVGNGTGFSPSYTLTVNVTPINDYAPTAANQALEIAQNGNRILTAANFGFADADGNDTLQMVKVTQLPTAGSLALSSVAVTLDQEITVADINAGNLRFTPALGASGYATFGFKVSDGTFYSVASSTMTIDLVPVAVTKSSSHIPFVSSGNLVGAAVFGNAGTYDGIPFSLWDTPFTTPLSLGSGVSVAMAVTGGGGFGSISGTAFGTSQQYQYGAFTISPPQGMTLTFTGLVSSREYRFQFGYGDFRTIFAYNETATLTLSDGASVPVQLAFGSAAAGDEYALLTATVRNTTSLVLTLPQTVAGYHGPMQAGFSVHAIPLPPRGTLITLF